MRPNRFALSLRKHWDLVIKRKNLEAEKMADTKLAGNCAFKVRIVRALSTVLCLSIAPAVVSAQVVIERTASGATSFDAQGFRATSAPNSTPSDVPMLVVGGDIDASGNKVVGVADPENEMDAVNLRTLREASAGIASNSAAIQKVEKDNNAGIAQSMAMSQLPFPIAGDTRAVGLAIGQYGGETSLALGGTFLLDNNMIARGAVSASGRGKMGAAGSIGWSW
jgi:hypothetical protein